MGSTRPPGVDIHVVAAIRRRSNIDYVPLGTSA